MNGGERLRSFLCSVVVSIGFGAFAWYALETLAGAAS